VILFLYVCWQRQDYAAHAAVCISVCNVKFLIPSTRPWQRLQHSLSCMTIVQTATAFLSQDSATKALEVCCASWPHRNSLSGYSDGATSIQQYVATVTHWVTNLTHTENHPTSIRSFSSAPVPHPAIHIEVSPFIYSSPCEALIPLRQRFLTTH